MEASCEELKKQLYHIGNNCPTKILQRSRKRRLFQEKIQRCWESVQEIFRKSSGSHNQPASAGDNIANEFIHLDNEIMVDNKDRG